MKNATRSVLKDIEDSKNIVKTATEHLAYAQVNSSKENPHAVTKQVNSNAHTNLGLPKLQNIES